MAWDEDGEWYESCFDDVDYGSNLTYFDWPGVPPNDFNDTEMNQPPITKEDKCTSYYKKA